MKNWLSQISNCRKLRTVLIASAAIGAASVARAQSNDATHLPDYVDVRNAYLNAIAWSTTGTVSIYQMMGVDNISQYVNSILINANLAPTSAPPFSNVAFSIIVDGSDGVTYWTVAYQGFIEWYTVVYDPDDGMLVTVVVPPPPAGNPWHWAGSDGLHYEPIPISW